MLRRPPNYDSLSYEDQVRIDERVYRSQLIGSHGHLHGSSLLRSGGKL